MDLLSYLQYFTKKLYMIMFKCSQLSAPAYLAEYCISTSLVPGRSALWSAAHMATLLYGVPSHHWGMWSFSVAGPSIWLRTFCLLIWCFPQLKEFGHVAKHLETGWALLHNRAHTFEFEITLVWCNKVTVSPRWQCHQTRLLLYRCIINCQLILD